METGTRPALLGANPPRFEEPARGLAVTGETSLGALGGQAAETLKNPHGERSGRATVRAPRRRD